MPVFTPSRVAVIVLTLSLLSFLWSFGLPHQLAEPSLPLLNHDAPGQKANEPVRDPLDQEFYRPYVPPSNPRHSLYKAPSPKPKPTPKPTSTPPPIPAESEIPNVKGEEDNKDKEEDKQQEKPEESATPVPAPVTSALAPFPTTTAVNATVNPPVNSSSTRFCNDVHDAPDIMVIVKTSKAEIQDKLPIHLKTLLSCVSNFVIFSDHAGKTDGFTIHDALDTISAYPKAVHNEFKEYEKMHQDENYKPDKSKTKELDKWKFLPMVYKAYKMRPDSRFYIFIEVDTSLSWTNLLQWVDKLDPRIPYYSGAPTFLGDVKFAQRGSGILLSKSAMEQYAKMYDERYESEWESRVGDKCCGDMVLATTLMESNVEFYSGFPLMQGETPSTLDWTNRHWCAPIVTWHHMTPLEIESLWTFQTNWTSANGWRLPYLFRDAFDSFVLPHIQETMDAWDNLSQDVRIEGPDQANLEKEKREEDNGKQKQVANEKEQEKEQVKDADSKPPQQKRKARSRTNLKSLYKPTQKGPRDDPDLGETNVDIDNAGKSAETCKHLCEITEDCLQWKFTSEKDHECVLGKVIRLGHKVEKTGSEGGFTSGWMLKKIQAKTEEWSVECAEPKWGFNQKDVKVSN